jgi:hypothetical protein
MGRRDGKLLELLLGKLLESLSTKLLLANKFGYLSGFKS